MTGVSTPTAEFFAGIGLVRLAVERAGFEVRWANDIERLKGEVYDANFGPDDYRLGDVRSVRGDDLPDVELATASFPCTDLSLAGYRAGLDGIESGMFWEFARVIEEMGDRRPRAVLLENVPGFATSNNGRDIRNALVRLDGLGYSCDLFQIDAALFVPQSRPRMFIIGSRDLPGSTPFAMGDDWARPAHIERVYAANSDLNLRREWLPAPAPADVSFADAVERFAPTDPIWWDAHRLHRFTSSLFPLHAERLDRMVRGRKLSWRTAYRRTRRTVATWEIRPDDLAGCLRTARGGSSKQAVVEAGCGRLRVRWMTAREYARLQGAPDLDLSRVTETQAMFGLGDAVCVPAVEWIAREYLRPMLAEGFTPALTG